MHTGTVAFADMHVSCRRLLGNQETIHVEVWTSITPPGTLTPSTLWSNMSQVWQTTKEWGYPMNITFLNATTFMVCAQAMLSILTCVAALSMACTNAINVCLHDERTQP